MTLERLTKDDLKESTREELISLIFTLDSLYIDRAELLELIPSCSLHGTQCVPYAKQWVLEQLSKDLPEGWTR